MSLLDPPVSASALARIFALRDNALRAAVVQALNTGAVTNPVVSGSVRSNVPTVTATASGSLCFVFRNADFSVVECRNPYFRVWNGYCIGDGRKGSTLPAGGVEALTGGAITVRMGFQIGGPGTAAANQAGATMRAMTFYGMMLNAAFLAAGGSVTPDGSTITIPDGWTADTDPLIGVTLAPLTRYFYTIEENYVSGALRITGSNGRTDLGDMRWTQTTNAASPVYAADWSVAYGGTTPSTIGGSTKTAIGVFGTGDGAARSQLVGIEGDSINHGGNDTGGNYGELGGLKRALVAAGYPYVSAAAPGTDSSDMKATGSNKVRGGLLKDATAIFSSHGHNDRGASLVPFGTFATVFLPYHQWHNHWLRSMAKPGARIIRSTLLPHTTSNNSWADATGQTAFQTSADGPTGWVATYADYLMRRGAYAGIPFSGPYEPDAAWDHFAAIGASVADFKWPAGGTTDGTHPVPALAVTAAADLQPRLPALIGF